MGQVCQVDDRGARREVDYKVTGCCITVFGTCTSGHQFNWNSSDILTSQVGGTIYLDNLNFASALVLSGNNYRKFMVFARFYGLQIIGATTFHRYQRNIICPAVDKFYKQEQVSEKYCRLWVSLLTSYCCSNTEQTPGPSQEQRSYIVWRWEV